MDKNTNKEIDTNSQIYRNVRNDLGDNIDHPKPLESDSEDREIITKNIILKEIRQNKTDTKKNKNNFQKVNDGYFSIIQNKEKPILSQNKVKNEKSIVRINLNEVNKILFKNKIKHREKEENKNNNSDLKAKNNLSKKIQNIFKENNNIIIKPFINNKIKTNINNNNITKENNDKTTIKEKNNNNFTRHKKNLSLNEKEFSNNNMKKISSYKSPNKTNINSENKNININKDLHIKPIYISQNPQKKFFLNQKNKNVNNNNNNKVNSNIDSSKEKNDVKNNILNLNNSNEKMEKKTFSRGGKYNNIQTTYIISTKNKNLKNIIKVNKNPILNNNTRINCKIKKINLNEINKNNSYNLVNKTPKKNYKTINSERGNGNNVFIYDKDKKNNLFNYYQQYSSLIKSDRTHSYNSINNYNFKNNTINNIKYNNIKSKNKKGNLEYINNKSLIYHDAYNNSIDYNRFRYWDNPIYDNYLGADANYPFIYGNY